MNADVRRMRFVIQAVDERCGDRSLELMSVSQYRGVVPRSEITDKLPRADDLSNYKVCQQGDIVVNRMSAYNGAVGRAPSIGIVSPDYIVFRPERGIEARWLNHLMRSSWFVTEMAARIRGIGSIGTANVRTPRVSAEEICDIRVAIPQAEEQRAIADYLDAETARIDALITKKQQLIHLLEERSRLQAEDFITSLRNELECVPLKYLVRESDRRLGEFAEPLVLSVSIHKGVVPRSEISDKESRADDFSNYKTCRPGQIAINRMRAFQGGVGVVRDSGVVSPDYTVLTLGDRLEPSFLHFLMRSDWFVSEMTKRLRGIGSVDQGAVRTPRVNFSDLGQIEVPVPSILDQQSLSADLQLGFAASQRASLAVREQLALIIEHRQALITAAVTGEISVPGAE